MELKRAKGQKGENQPPGGTNRKGGRKEHLVFDIPIIREGKKKRKKQGDLKKCP